VEKAVFGGGGGARFAALGGMSTLRRRYPSDLTDAQWAVVQAAMPPAKGGHTGRPRRYPLREIWNALFYLAREGCSWRALPHDFPPWDDVWEHFRRWRDAGTLERVHAALRAQVRVRDGRAPTPSAVSIDSQSVKTTEKGGPKASTPRSRSRAASATSSSTRLG
jgi:transposase